MNSNHKSSSFVCWPQDQHNVLGIPDSIWIVIQFSSCYECSFDELNYSNHVLKSGNDPLNNFSINVCNAFCLAVQFLQPIRNLQKALYCKFTLNFSNWIRPWSSYCNIFVILEHCCPRNKFNRSALIHFRSEKAPFYWTWLWFIAFVSQWVTIVPTIDRYIITSFKHFHIHFCKK